MSPSQETGCSEVSTTVTLIDGNTTTSKDDSSRSTTTSPAIEQQKLKIKSNNDPEVRNVYEDETTGDKETEKRNVEAQHISKKAGEIINVEDVYDCQDEDIDSRMKKFEHLGMYNNRVMSPEHSNSLGKNIENGSINNNKKTNNSKVRFQRIL